MDEWPLGEAEHEVIREIFRMQLRRFRLKPLLDYLRNRKLARIFHEKMFNNLLN